MNFRPITNKEIKTNKQYLLTLTELKAIERILKSNIDSNIEFALTVVTKIRDHKEE